MEQLIPIASKLQDVLGALGQTTAIDLPQIVVVGGQSSGKSSVLEAIVGRSFLPRGSGIVTRRPLVLQLFNTSHDGQSETEFGEFLHQPGKRYHDFVSIRSEIVRETERLTGPNKGIDHAPIHLKIYSPEVLSLTLVDLPGIAKVPVGDQPENIEEQIREMCMEYISNPNAIILAVTSANQDIANSDALKLAQAVDPHGTRTVGVLTKLDLMDDGTDASDILMNRVIPLRRGYVAVVNRGQRDVNNDLSIQDGLKKEESFFRAHSVYGRDRQLLAKCGTKRLSQHLNTMLMHHIRDCLPDLKNRIINMAVDVNQELEALGTPASVASGPSSGGELLRLLSKFSTNFTAIIEGRGGQNDLRGQRSKCDPFRELFGGARISTIFTEVFAATIFGVGPFDGLSDEEIRTTICNAHGTRPALFVPEVSFDILIRRQIARLEQPGVQCVDLVYEELQRISSQSEPSELTRFPTLRDRMIEVVNMLLKRAMEPTQMMVSNLVKIELAYINTSHPDFIGGSRAVAQLMEKVGKENDDRRSTLQSGSVAGVSNNPLSPTVYRNASENFDDDNGVFPDGGPGDSGIMNFIFRGKPTVQPQRHRGNSGPSSVVHLPQVPDTMKQTDTPPTERDQVEMQVIKSLIDSYFKIVRKNFVDLVPKTIMYYLVNHVRDAMQNELVSELYRDAEVGNLMQEAEDIAQRRQTCEEMSDLLGKAMDIVTEVRDFNTFK
ncbi:Dynamin-1-like protein [Seminavis robusta]|uniref:Dynamin-1-like protein n=1 Tax=Seminavis robusta TaxID=568900 RepID=A0A9N8E064_9STRA|nr:Dynamin-1-like protein [Seminavis robusta]|eukprot:Sro518_g158900.1 Dynamin-1-like protein (720) ;mRNA; r:51478-54207